MKRQALFHSHAKTSSHDDNHMLSQNICVWTIHSKMSLDKFRGFCCCLSSVESLADPSEVLSVTLPDGNYHWIELNSQLCAALMRTCFRVERVAVCLCVTIGVCIAKNSCRSHQQRSTRRVTGSHRL